MCARQQETVLYSDAHWKKMHTWKSSAILYGGVKKRRPVRVGNNKTPTGRVELRVIHRYEYIRIFAGVRHACERLLIHSKGRRRPEMKNRPRHANRRYYNKRRLDYSGFQWLAWLTCWIWSSWVMPCNTLLKRNYIIVDALKKVLINHVSAHIMKMCLNIVRLKGCIFGSGKGNI